MRSYWLISSSTHLERKSLVLFFSFVEKHQGKIACIIEPESVGAGFGFIAERFVDSS